MVLNKRKSAIYFVLALFFIFQIISLIGFSNAEEAVISFTFNAGDVIIYDSHAYKFLKNTGDIKGIDKKSVLNEYILKLGEDSENFNKTFIRLNRSEECVALRENYVDNNEITYKPGDNPWLSKDFWEAFFYVDPCSLDMFQDSVGRGWNFTKNQTSIKIGWMFGTNTFSGESKLFPMPLAFFPFRIWSVYPLKRIIEEGDGFDLGDFAFILVLAFVFVISNLIVGFFIQKLTRSHWGYLKKIIVGAVAIAFIPGFFMTRNSLFAFMCLIFFTIMLWIRMDYLMKKKYSRGFSFNLLNLYGSLFPARVPAARSLTFSLMDNFESRLYSVEFILFLLYPFLGSVPVINVILSFLTLEVLFAPLFWRALLCTFVLFMLVQFWPMISRYNKKRRLYKKAMEKVAGEEVLKEMGRA